MIPGIHQKWSFRRGDLHPLTLSVRCWSTSKKDLLELDLAFPDRMDYPSSRPAHWCHSSAGLNTHQAVELGWWATHTFEGEKVIRCKHSNGHHNSALILSRDRVSRFSLVSTAAVEQSPEEDDDQDARDSKEVHSCPFKKT